MGGFGSAIIEFMVDQKYQSEVVRLGIPDEYIHHGTQEELWDECGFDVSAIIKTIEKLVSIAQSSTSSFIQAG
jgi:1-deoxy-D-xylulose-5-phosphate synthase